MAAVLGALLLYAAPATRTPRLVGGLGVFGMLYGLVSMLVPAEAWAAYVEAVHGLMLHHSVVGGATSIAVALALLWTVGTGTPRPVAPASVV